MVELGQMMGREHESEKMARRHSTGHRTTANTRTRMGDHGEMGRGIGDGDIQCHGSRQGERGDGRDG
jgi:hypothetical protein